MKKKIGGEKIGRRLGKKIDRLEVYTSPVGDASTLCERVAKESFEIFVNSRDTIVNNPVDEDQAVPDPQDSSLSKILTSLAPCNCYFCQDNRYQFLRRS